MSDETPRASEPEAAESSFSDAYYQPMRTDDNAYGYSPTTGSRRHDPVPASEHRPIGAKRLLIISAILLLAAAAFLIVCSIMLSLQIRRLHTLAADELALGEAAAEKYEEYTQPAETEDYVLSLDDTDTIGVLSADVVYAQACEFTVGIATQSADLSTYPVSGTGIILTEDGYILTNYHVIESACEDGRAIAVLTSDGMRFTADVTGIEEDLDLAVLKVSASGLTAAPLADTDDLLVGETVFTLGNPLGDLTFTLTRGIISALNRTITTDNHVTINVFQIDAAVNSGSSGGPVLNEYGQVIGIVTAKYTSDNAEGIGFAIPAADAMQAANELILHGYVSGKAYLGLTVGTFNERMAAFYDSVPGVYVYEVESGSCADTAGIQPGDVITAIGSTTVTEQTDLVEALRSYHAGDSEQLTVYRGGETITMTVTFDEDLPKTYTPGTADTASAGPATEEPAAR